MSRTMDNDDRPPVLPNGGGTPEDKGLRRVMLDSPHPVPHGIPCEKHRPAQGDEQMQAFHENGRAYDGKHVSDPPVRPRRSGTKN